MNSDFMVGRKMTARQTLLFFAGTTCIRNAFGRGDFDDADLGGSLLAQKKSGRYNKFLLSGRLLLFVQNDLSSMLLTHLYLYGGC